MKIVVGIYLVILTIASFYFGAAGLINNQHLKELNSIPKEDFVTVIDSTTKDVVAYEFKNQKYASKGSARAAAIISSVPKLYRWLFNESDVIILIITCCFLGVLGAITRIIQEFLFEPSPPPVNRLFYLPILGLFSGFIVLSVSYAIPQYLTTNTTVNLNPLSVMLICLIGGVYAELFMAWLKKIADTIFQ